MTLSSLLLPILCTVHCLWFGRVMMAQRSDAFDTFRKGYQDFMDDELPKTSFLRQVFRLVMDEETAFKNGIFKAFSKSKSARHGSSCWVPYEAFLNNLVKELQTRQRTSNPATLRGPMNVFTALGLTQVTGVVQLQLGDNTEERFPISTCPCGAHSLDLLDLQGWLYGIRCCYQHGGDPAKTLVNGALNQVRRNKIRQFLECIRSTQTAPRRNQQQWACDMTFILDDIESQIDASMRSLATLSTPDAHQDLSISYGMLLWYPKMIRGLSYVLLQQMKASHPTYYA